MMRRRSNIRRRKESTAEFISWTGLILISVSGRIFVFVSCVS
jgi:hypothetical protein